MKNRITKQARLYQLDIPICAITGSIGTGKSTVTGHLKQLGHTCLDADELIKLIYQKEESKEFIADLSPNLITAGQINFRLLRQTFFQNLELKERVQTYLYGKIEEQFFNELKKLGEITYLFYDIPLLFERSLQNKFDYTVVVYCPKVEQIKRIGTRDGISKNLIEKIIASQMDIEEKRKNADHVLDNTSNRAALYRQADALIRSLRL